VCGLRFASPAFPQPSGREAPGAIVRPAIIDRLFGRIGARAKMPFPIHPHMLRHGCGYALANAGHDTRALQAWLGHKNIQHTVRYTELAPDRFRNDDPYRPYGSQG
jgi:site-specific recombinase XerD